MDKFTINIRLTRPDKGDYPLLDANQVLLSVAEQFKALTDRHDTRLKLPVRLVLDDPELGFSGKVSAAVEDDTDLRQLSKLELVALVLRLQGDGPALRRMSDDELAKLVLERAKSKKKAEKKKAK